MDKYASVIQILGLLTVIAGVALLPLPLILMVAGVVIFGIGYRLEKPGKPGK